MFSLSSVKLHFSTFTFSPSLPIPMMKLLLLALVCSACFCAHAFEIPTANEGPQRPSSPLSSSLPSNPISNQNPWANPTPTLAAPYNTGIVNPAAAWTWAPVPNQVGLWTPMLVDPRQAAFLPPQQQQQLPAQQWLTQPQQQWMMTQPQTMPSSQFQPQPQTMQSPQFQAQEPLRQQQQYPMIQMPNQQVPSGMQIIPASQWPSNMQIPTSDVPMFSPNVAQMMAQQVGYQQMNIPYQPFLTSSTPRAPVMSAAPQPQQQPQQQQGLRQPTMTMPGWT